MNLNVVFLAFSRSTDSPRSPRVAPAVVLVFSSFLKSSTRKKFQQKTLEAQKFSLEEKTEEKISYVWYNE